MKLVLGVLNFPYDNPDAVGETRTTGDVALSLEERYGVMGHFYNMHKGDITSDMAPGFASMLSAELNGEHVDVRATFAQTNMDVKSRFSVFLNTREMDRLGVPGVPTAASLSDSRAKRPGEPAGPRPSFIDTGLYMASFIAFESDD